MIYLHQKKLQLNRARKIVSLMKEAQDHHDGAVTLRWKTN